MVKAEDCKPIICWGCCSPGCKGCGYVEMIGNAIAWGTTPGKVWGVPNEVMPVIVCILGSKKQYVQYLTYS